jgi:hypothetical protein
MPTDVLKVSGSYLLDAGQGDITLNVTNSISTGTVNIIGNLNVIGTTAQIQSIDSSIKDNILVLNSGETANPGITLGTSGIMISRGNNDDPTLAAYMLYDETGNGVWSGPGGELHQGTFVFSSAGGGSAIRVNAIRIDSNTTSTLHLLGVDSGDALVTVSGQVGYAGRVRLGNDPNAIPNKQYVDEALYAGTDIAKRLQVGNSSLRMTDNSLSQLDPYYDISNRLFAALGTSTNVVFDLFDNTLRLVGLTIDSTVITANTADDIVLQPLSGNAVVIKETLKLGQRTTSTTVVPDANIDTIYYSETVGGGGTGLYYVNTNQSDELVSRRKAIIYGIIF